MSEQEARVVADERIARELCTVLPCGGGRYEGAPNASWTFSYRRATESGEVTEPTHVVVVVDVESRRASFFSTI